MNDKAQKRTFLRRFWPVILWACIIIAVSSIPHLSVPGTKIKLADKLAHFLEFAVFGYLLACAMTSSQMSLGGRRILLILLIGVLFAILDETYQSLVPGRQKDTFDGLADILGVIAALLLWHMVGWIRGLCRAGVGQLRS